MSLKVGFIGTGGIAVNKHMPALDAMDDVEIVALCDIAQDQAQTAAAQYGGQVFTDHRRMFDAVDLDAVWVCVPPFAHTDAELIAAQRGIHLFAEKPVALEMDKALEILAAVEAAGIITAVGYVPRNTAPGRQAKAFLADKTVIMAGITRFGGVPGDPDHWWRVMAKSGGPLVEQTTHNVDLLCYLLGQVEEVYASYGLQALGDMPNLDIPDVQVINLKFASGTLAYIGISCALTQGGGGQTAEFVLRDMRLSYSGQGLALRPEGAAQLPPLPEVAHIDREFVDAILTKDPTAVGCTYRQGAITLDVTLAANQSARTGKPVKPYFAS